jgi:hypothetical protein
VFDKTRFWCFDKVTMLMFMFMFMVMLCVLRVVVCGIKINTSDTIYHFFFDYQLDFSFRKWQRSKPVPKFSSSEATAMLPAIPLKQSQYRVLVMIRVL